MAHPGRLSQGSWSRNAIQILWPVLLLLPLSGSSNDHVAPSRTEVIRDELSISLRGAKPQFLTVHFERRQLIHFAEHDMVAHTRFSIPQSLDPLYDGQFIPWEKRQEQAIVPRWVNVRIDAFSAHIIHPDGSREELAHIGHIQRGEMRTFRTMEKIIGHIHELQGVRPGDLVEVHWKYMIPYDQSWPASRGWRSLEWMDNWARLTNWRVFFHGELPVRHQVVQLTYDRRHGLVYRGPEPDERLRRGHEMICRWEHFDLPGCINEPNARPARDLPHLEVLLEPEDLRYWRRDRLSGFPFQQPYWLHVVRHREARAFWWRQVSRKRVPDKQNQLVRDFIRREAGDLPDQSPVEKLERVHERIAQSFRYEDDDLWYRDVDRDVQKIGEQLRDQRIRDISRYDMYSKLINALRLDHRTAYVMDSRVGRMGRGFLSPIWDSEFLFHVRSTEEDLWLHPKRGQHGLLAGELPFYWQGTAALSIDLELLLDDLPPPPLFIELPGGAAAGNVRGTEYIVDVDLQQGRAEVGMRAFLSGQYSTLGRAAYLDLPLDSTVDPLYGRRAWDIEGAELVVRDHSKVEQDSPFRMRANARAVLDPQRFFAASQEARAIRLRPFISHVVPQPFEPQDRHLPFHWDLAGSDHYKVELIFDTPVEVLNSHEIDGRMATSGCSYERRVRMAAPDRVVMEAVLRVDNERVELYEMEELAQIVRMAQEELILRVRPIELVLEPMLPEGQLDQ